MLLYLFVREVININVIINRY